ncbi:MAG TPA: hypothetical protein VLU46_16205 [Thermoanaerobaculia bacterium]|nr:hypothetical protein [Thermoanaerobaculia bacterium]
MQREFIVGFNLLSYRNGEFVTDTPVIPLKIVAETAAAALEVFARRSEGVIIDASHNAAADAIDARIAVDQRIFRVRVCDGSIL